MVIGHIVGPGPEPPLEVNSVNGVVIVGDDSDSFACLNDLKESLATGYQFEPIEKTPQVSPPVSHVYTFQDQERQGKVTVNVGAYGLDIIVEDGSDKWDFALDLFHLSPAAREVSGTAYARSPSPGDKGQRAVQIISYGADVASDGEPIMHTRVYADGRVENIGRNE